MLVVKNIRNFAIIAHVDHGKSTLADRLLEVTKTVDKRHMRSQLLDSNPIERERGITIKLAPVCMKYVYLSQEYTLNLIDTPGHVDFSYEVNRSLAACEGAVLLVDATQGIQAQTLAHFYQAKKLGISIIPVINKIDIATADVEATKKQIVEVLKVDGSDILQISGKTGSGVTELLSAIINKIPPPQGNSNSPLRALIFNSNFDSHLGVVAWIRIVDGQLSIHDKLKLVATNSSTTALEVGIFTPTRQPTKHLQTGSVGYIVTSLKEITQIAIGDTLTHQESLVNALPGYQPSQPVVFVSFYPTDGAEINTLRDSLSKLSLQDSSLTFTPEFSPALGNGFRVGFLGLLHADIVQERLEREFGLSLIAAAPSVGYKVVLSGGQEIKISKAQDLPDPSQIQDILEPMLTCSIFLPESYIGSVMQLCQNHRGNLIDMLYLGNLVELKYTLPLSELIRGFYDQLKSVSQGFATLDYELTGFQSEDLVKLDILIAGEKVDALSQIIPSSQSLYTAKELVEKLKDIIPRAQFEIPIQAAIGSHVLARSDVKAFRKDVIAKLSGGDQTRKDKLLKKQKKGKARMKRVGKVDLPQEAFLSILKVR
jgi:GTP-binding protein LepA